MNPKGWRSVVGCTYESLALFRITLGLLLCLELVLRFRFLHPFYTDDGTLPTHLLMDKVDSLFKKVCLHCHFGSLKEQQVILTVQVFWAVLFTIGQYTKFASVVSWYLYLSLTLRNTWMNYILDRYFHYLLFLSMFLPLDHKWAMSPHPVRRSSVCVCPATIALKALVTWIYLDAGYGKWADPLGGWTYNADPLPALDTYARHTVAAQYMYALLGPSGLRFMTPIVVYVELFVAPVAHLASWMGHRGMLYTAIGLIWSLHIGIAIMLRNAALLSFVACVPWFAFLPFGKSQASSTFATVSTDRLLKHAVAALCISIMISGSIWLSTISRACDQSVKHIWSTVFHNRWNVFVGAEEYVTWEIAPGLLRDGSVVDVWGRRDEVSWDLPGDGAPCTSTTRPGRWRSFPYLAELEGEDGEALWSYLCKEWDTENSIHENPGRELVKFNFFMLQADVLPNMNFSATRKRLIKSYECGSKAEEPPATGVSDIVATEAVSGGPSAAEEL